MQSHIWLTASSKMVKYLLISSYIRKPFLIYDFTPDPIPSEFPHIWGKFYFIFYQCTLCTVCRLPQWTLKRSCSARSPSMPASARSRPSSCPSSLLGRSKGDLHYVFETADKFLSLHQRQNTFNAYYLKKENKLAWIISCVMNNIDFYLHVFSFMRPSYPG